ncbi:vacuolar protein sorting-associated protein 8 homolog isoform X2 [Octopus bimaculoides]|uniref:vacuolar protein sorting-associated protein 8 homolog isoform X2 n=1 Tax=Octopus bimaculoides TaxID=37653 RepID=UPI00071C9439|nr:vacuolar protein sorting-associated protein 8 homolog isoform X2 [Octopus bimaculoides]|eukprot:XP_014767622.1 PREDICTED: vacuolar protein sorting-associated protein 8 homolog isoform X2 [Octopus bimaculoides]
MAESQDLDAQEFDLPPVETPPTLESILNAPDDDDELLLEDEELGSLSQLYKGDSVETSSMSSQDSLISDRPRQRTAAKRQSSSEAHGTVLKPSKLKNISAQLKSAANRVDAGKPSAIAVASLIAIGTSHGIVLVFDPRQVLKWCLGSTAVGAQYGSVSALSFNRDCSRLLCGFAKGQITMWDLTNGKLLRTITDAHPPGTAVLHVKFTDSPVIAVCSDSGGSVFELEFKRLIGVRTCESKCLFSGSRGEVCVIEPLHMNYTIQDHPMHDVMILAMASLSKVLIVTLRPQLKIMFTHPLKGDSSTLPLLAWQFVIIQISESDRVIDPVLAFARDSTIYFYQVKEYLLKTHHSLASRFKTTDGSEMVICNNAQDIRCSGLQKMELPYKLLSITWMNPRTLVTLDTTEKIHVIDVRSEEELEIVDIADVQLVYGSSHFKSLATGGNVSEALAFAGEQACYQSVVSHGGQLFLLGTESVTVFSVRSWMERIEVLVKQNKYRSALALALSFYEGKAKAVVGLVGSSRKRKGIVKDLMLNLLFEFVDLSMTQFCPEKGKIETLEDYYQGIVPVCVDYCLCLECVDILFGRIYDRFGMDVIAKDTFLECLEPYILDDKLSSIPPTVMKDFVEHYEGKGMLESVEACIVHLEVTTLDIHHIVHLCWNHGLYDAIIYVYNKGMNDYTTPLEELLILLEAAINTGKQLTDDQIRLGNKLLVYISYCLAGRGYPLGDIPEEFIPEVKEQVFKCVSCLHRTKSKENEPAYPHLRTLLQFDTIEFLNVLALAFEEPEFNTDEGIQKRQRVIDILLQVMVESVGFNPSQIGTLFTFLARQMARHENTILVNRVLFEQVLEFLSNPDEATRHEERQQAMMELLMVGGLNIFSDQRLLQLAENAKFYRVCEFVYEKNHHYDKILVCHLKDYTRRHMVFPYINRILHGDGYSAAEKESVKVAALENLIDLVNIDCKKAAKVVIFSLSCNLSDVVEQLRNKPRILYDFLQGVLSYKESVGNHVNPDKQVTIEPIIYELYIDLQCQFHTSNVYNFIKNVDGYRLEETLKIVNKYDIPCASAHILEKMGDILGAFNIMLATLNKKVHTFTDAILSKKLTKAEAVIQLQEVQASLLVVIQLCQRNSGKMDEGSREAMWFPLLESMMAPQRKLKDLDDREIITDIQELTHHILNSMMGYIALPSILQKIMQDPAYNTGKFGEVKELILGMLETYNYEETLMKTCKNLLHHDLHLHLKRLRSEAVKGFMPCTEHCSLCNKTLSHAADADLLLIFRCGHSYHTSCLRGIGSLHVIDGEDFWSCYLCSNSKKKGRTQSTRFHRASTLSSVVAQSSHSGALATQTKEEYIDPQHAEAFENLRKSMKTPSRLAILTELSKNSTSQTTMKRTSSILKNENFNLRLAPPRSEIYF